MHPLVGIRHLTLSAGWVRWPGLGLLHNPTVMPMHAMQARWWLRFSLSPKLLLQKPGFARKLMRRRREELHLSRW
jgi:hypothetical protein